MKSNLIRNTIFAFFAMLVLISSANAQAINLDNYKVVDIQKGETVGQIALRETRNANNWKSNQILVINSRSRATIEKSEQNMRRLWAKNDATPNATFHQILIPKTAVKTAVITLEEPTTIQELCDARLELTVPKADCVNSLAVINQVRNLAEPINTALYIPTEWRLIPDAPVAPAPPLPTPAPVPTPAPTSYLWVWIVSGGILAALLLLWYFLFREGHDVSRRSRSRVGLGALGLGGRSNPPPLTRAERLTMTRDFAKKFIVRFKEATGVADLKLADDKPPDEELTWNYETNPDNGVLFIELRPARETGPFARLPEDLDKVKKITNEIMEEDFADYFELSEVRATPESDGAVLTFKMLSIPRRVAVA